MGEGRTYKVQMFHVQRFDSFRTLNFELGTLSFRTTAALPLTVWLAWSWPAD